jgi:6-pyruvoyltetrahydropterin/6-carboxytetrahydropterin synthase
MYSINKTLKDFSAAHRILKGYQGKCRHLHGHNYSVTVSLSADTLNQYDFVMDFDEVKTLLDNWVQVNWDHCILISEDDEALLAFAKADNQHHFVLPDNKNTSAECLAEFLFQQFRDMLATIDVINKSSLQLQAVEVAETAFSKACYQQ